MTQTVPSEKKIISRFTQFRNHLSDIWCSYCLIDYYLPLVHKLVKTDVVPSFEHETYVQKNRQLHSKVGTYGLIQHVCTKVNPRKSLIDAVSHTEDLLQYIATVSYRDFPEKLSSEGRDAPERVDKLLDVILGSQDKKEMIDKLVEEKVRGIFYGNASLFFLKDRARLGFGTYFASCHQKTIDMYMEILARRNVLIHNNGRVDRKYLKEIPGCGMRLGNMVPIDREYLRSALHILRGLAANVAFLVVKNVYKIKPANPKLASIRKAFNDIYETH
jgi:hypothetical protein